MQALRILFSSLLIIISIEFSYAQMKTTRQETKEYYPGGALKKLIITEKKKESKIDLFNNYLKTTIRITELYTEGTVQSREKIIDKIGEAGGPCYHILETRKEFSEKGKICYYYKSRCDKRKMFYKVYNNNGRLLNTTVFKRHQWE